MSNTRFMLSYELISIEVHIHTIQNTNSDKMARIPFKGVLRGELVKMSLHRKFGLNTFIVTLIVIFICELIFFICSLV